MEFALIDHYDSFSFNLLDWLDYNPGVYKIRHVYFDDFTAMRAVADQQLPLVLSPGPKTPQDATITWDLVNDMLGKAPILGVCLGHQILACVQGATLKQSKHPFHGATRKLHQESHGLVFPAKSIVKVASYNSLVVELPRSLRKCITMLNQWGEVEMVEYVRDFNWPAVGVQYHPESFMSQGVEDLRHWFLNSVRSYYQSRRPSALGDSTLADPFVADHPHVCP